MKLQVLVLYFSKNDHTAGLAREVAKGVEEIRMDGGFTIGGNSGNELFHGVIADIRIFNRVLSDAEIEALAQR